MNTEIRAFCITINGHAESEKGYETLKNSTSVFNIEKFNAIVPETVNETLLKEDLRWSYPWYEKDYCAVTNLYKPIYRTANREQKIACSLSHYLLIKQSIKDNVPILILEHDAVFTKEMNKSVLDDILSQKQFNYIGINNPDRATRNAALFHNEVMKGYRTNHLLIETPWIDNNKKIPQGLAGNSAYIVTPDGAKDYLEMINKTGLWINDAFLCKQIFKDKVGVTTTYYTKIQKGLTSTTTL